MELPTIKVLQDRKELALEAAELIRADAEQAIALAERFTLFLAGGSTPRTLYELLADEYEKRIDWARTHVYFGDERPVGPTDEQSNFRMANESLLLNVETPGSQIHRMEGELPPEEAAGRYDRLLRDHFADDTRPDVILLGMGTDGHTASLFPHTAALDVEGRYAIANEVPQLSTTRITTTASFINRARHVIVLVSGQDKADRVREVLEEARDPHRLPIQMIAPEGKFTWLMDHDAAGM